MHSQIPSREPGTEAIMNGYVSLSAHPSYSRTQITFFFFCYFIPESYFSIKARKHGNIIGSQNSWSVTSFYERVSLLPITNT